MNDEINYKNNPLHGVGLKSLLNDLVDQYGFELLFAYLNINCFNTNPSIESSVKFLKNTEWAREKVEVFYLYEYKNLPRASNDQFLLSPRDRIIPEHQKPGAPAELSFEDADRLQEKREKKAASRGHSGGQRSGNAYAQRGGRKGNERAYSPTRNRDSDRDRDRDGESSRSSVDAEKKVDPWANSRNRSKD